MNSTHFDKILLTALVLIFAGLAFRAFLINSNDLAIFASDNAKLFSGALLTLITGRALQTRNGDSKSNGGSSEKSKDGPTGDAGGVTVVSKSSI